MFCSCGRPGTFVCDWKIAGNKSGMCDRLICDRCTLEVAPLKHLCVEHQKAFDAWKRRHPAVDIASLRKASPLPSLQPSLFPEELS
jgi:hypothetical protein